MRYFQDLPLWANIAWFAAGAVVVWFAGVRLSRGADAITDRTGLGQAFIGALLLGGTTSLPEVATTISASLIGDAKIAVNNVLGGIAMQVAILALADWASGPRPLTLRNRTPGVILQGTLLSLVLAVTAIAIAVGDTAVLGVGVWSTAILVLAVAGLFLIKEYDPRPQWKPTSEPIEDEQEENDAVSKMRERLRSAPTRKIVIRLILASLAVLVGGFVVAQSGERIAEQTGLGSSFVGAILIAIATSLPEVSTSLEAVRLGARTMAISNIFGTNLFDAALIFFADVTYGGPPVLNEVGRFAEVGALLGLLCTMIYVAGLVEKRDRSIGRLGIDSVLVVVVYFGGVVLLYSLR